MIFQRSLEPEIRRSLNCIQLSTLFPFTVTFLSANLMAHSKFFKLRNQVDHEYKILANLFICRSLP